MAEAAAAGEAAATTTATSTAVRLLNFRGVQTYLTCVQCSKYMAELVYMTLVKSLYTDPATLALTEMLDSYGDDVVFGNPSLYLAEWVRFQKPSTYSSQSWNSQLGKDTLENYTLQLYIARKREEKKGINLEINIGDISYHTL